MKTSGSSVVFLRQINASSRYSLVCAYTIPIHLDFVSPISFQNFTGDGEGLRRQEALE
jgi:hypothetical protein